jgi:hypothetical protein
MVTMMAFAGLAAAAEIDWAEREPGDMMGEMDAPSISVDHSMRC